MSIDVLHAYSDSEPSKRLWGIYLLQNLFSEQLTEIPTDKKLVESSFLKLFYCLNACR